MAAGRVKLKWNGPIIAAAFLQAAKRAVDETTAECVVLAKGKAPFQYGVLQGSIMAKPAKITGSGGVAAEWGSFDVNYAIYQELGTYKMAAQPYLRPSAEIAYPGLEGKIRALGGLA